MPKSRKVKRAGQGPDNAASMEPPKVFVMDRDIESQIPYDDDDLRRSDSGDLIPPPPPLYSQPRKKSAPTPSPPAPPMSEDADENDDIDLPSNESRIVFPQQKTSVIPIPNDVESALKSNPDFDLGADYGIYDEQFDGGKTHTKRRRRKHSKSGKKTKRRGKGKKSKRRGRK
jgi:hypothetical protein